MPLGNEWTERDILKIINDEGEIFVHKTFENHAGLRTEIKKMQATNVVKEVHTNREYRFYAKVRR